MSQHFPGREMGTQSRKKLVQRGIFVGQRDCQDSHCRVDGLRWLSVEIGGICYPCFNQRPHGSAMDRHRGGLFIKSGCIILFPRFVR
jgi:hypothetical protein